MSAPPRPRPGRIEAKRLPTRNIRSDRGYPAGQMSDLEDALERARAGDANGMAELYRAYAAPLLAYLVTRCGAGRTRRICWARSSCLRWGMGRGSVGTSAASGPW